MSNNLFNYNNVIFIEKSIKNTNFKEFFQNEINCFCKLFLQTTFIQFRILRFALAINQIDDQTIFSALK